MKKLLVIMVLSFLVIPSISLAFTPQEIEFINKVKELSSVDQKLPKSPVGYGIIRNDSNGNIFILLKGENENKGKFIGVTKYGAQITAVYEK